MDGPLPIKLEITYVIHNDFQTIHFRTCIQKLHYRIHAGNQVFQYILSNLNLPIQFRKHINPGLYIPH